MGRVLARAKRGKAWVEIRGWGDPRPEFNVVFRDDAKFTGDKCDVQDRALVYARTVYKLTGEWP